MPTNAAASAPKACDNAVNCGTDVIGIKYASGAPTAVPITIAIRIHSILTAPVRSSVPMIASSMPNSPAKTPRRAVTGELNHLIARTTHSAATI